MTVLLSEPSKTVDASYKYTQKKTTKSSLRVLTSLFFFFVRIYIYMPSKQLSQVPDASAVEFLIDGSWVPAVSVIGDSGWLDLSTSTPQGGRVLEGEVSGLAEAVRGRGAAVLGARKLSSAMSAANAIAGHLSDWLAPAAVSGSYVMRGERGCM